MKHVLLIALAAALSLNACSKKSEQAPVVLAMQQENTTPPSLPSNLNPTAPHKEMEQGLEITDESKAVVTEMTLSRKLLLDTEFLYGASLQFSSLMEGNIATALMSIAIGHQPARFQVIDQKLQLLTDSRIQFESDVNHPSRLIHEFPILRQDEKTITIRADKASVALATMLFGPGTPKERSSWIRSLEFVSDKNLLLIESTVETSDGSIAMFMETIMPRASLVPADAKALLTDPSLEPAAERFRFLDAGMVWMDIPEVGRIPTAAAQRFLVKEGEVIRWWVTGNAPEEVMLDLKNGVEAWNRYSQKMWGKDLVRFEGRLPKGVKIGDPRYNIIVWDKVQDAGSAYESQASDPLTGIQSHSLVYMPLAWLNIGKEYWNMAQDSDADAILEKQEAKTKRLAKILQGKNLLGQKIAVRCLESSISNISATSMESPEEFGRSLLKAVLFHEIGHALGLAHNFKGSMAFDSDDEHSHFTHSIMDYNHYNEEGYAFDSIDVAEGPLLEYDRQILSVLYNEGKDIADSDAVLPVCNDAEADSSIGGVDPLCVRYDIGKDPTKDIHRSLQLLNESSARKGRLKSAIQSLESVQAKLPAAEKVVTVEQAARIVMKQANTAYALLHIYIGGSANSLAYLSSQVTKNLYTFRAGSLPEGYNEKEMRERTLEAVNIIANMEQLPSASAAKLDAMVSATQDWLLATPALQNDIDRDAKVKKILANLESVKGRIQAVSLSRMRTRLLGSLMYSSTAPLHLERGESGDKDYEEIVIAILEKAVMQAEVANKAKPVAERIAAAKSLKTFRKTEKGADALQKARAAVALEIRQAKNAVSREELRALHTELL